MEADDQTDAAYTDSCDGCKTFPSLSNLCSGLEKKKYQAVIFSEVGYEVKYKCSPWIFHVHIKMTDPIVHNPYSDWIFNVYHSRLYLMLMLKNL